MAPRGKQGKLKIKDKKREKKKEKREKKKRKAEDEDLNDETDELEEADKTFQVEDTLEDVRLCVGKTGLDAPCNQDFRY